MVKGVGPLAGVRVLEFAGLGPAPFCGMLFSDLGANVVRIDRPDARYAQKDVISRGRRSVALNLKAPAAIETALKLAEQADILIEGFRPGVMERFGLGPDIVQARAPKLVYGRMTGWGQTGPKAKEPGHDINYIAQVGALHAIGPAEEPIIPLNFVGDFGGGATYLAFGLLAALMQARATGKGQVVDCAMIDGTASLMSMTYGRFGADDWHDRREANSIDGGSHFYNVYQCADDLWIAVGAIEPQFYNNFLDALGVNGPDFHPQRDQGRWPAMKEKIATLIKTRPRDEWVAHFSKSECCVTPVLTMGEASGHPDNLARDMFRRIDGTIHVMPAPRFSDSPNLEPGRVVKPGDHQDDALADWGFSKAEIAAIRNA
jgi:alpha-methylacyl-CoA racemase